MTSGPRRASLEQQQAALVAELAPILDRYGGTAGLLVEEAKQLSKVLSVTLGQPR